MAGKGKGLLKKLASAANAMAGKSDKSDKTSRVDGRVVTRSARQNRQRERLEAMRAGASSSTTVHDDDDFVDEDENMRTPDDSNMMDVDEHNIGGDDDDDAEDDDGDDDDDDDVPVDHARLRRGQDFKPDSGSLTLKGPFPGGPKSTHLIPSFKTHKAAYIWHGQDYTIGRIQSRKKALKTFECNLDFLTQARLEVSGLYHLRGCYTSTLHPELMMAFVERWQPETSSFHMPWGEMTITLHDVAYILGLRLEGIPVDKDPQIDEVEQSFAKLTGMSLTQVQKLWSKNGIDWKVIQEHLERQNFEKRACGYLMFLLGFALFPTKAGTTLKPYWIHYVLDLDVVGNFSWGSAVLANLYRELGIASRATVKGLAGCTTLLQCWIYEYFPEFRPEVSGAFDNSMPRFKMWDTRRTARKSLKYYRKRLDDMAVESVEWLPYGEDVHQVHPMSLYHGPIQFMDRVEPYMPDRALRQFGYVQTIPRHVIPPSECSRGYSSAAYKVTFHAPGGTWGTGHFIDLDCERKARAPYECKSNYMGWYLPLTHPRICNPDHETGRSRGINSAPPDQPTMNQLVKILWPAIYGRKGNDLLTEMTKIQSELIGLMMPHAEYLRLLNDFDGDDDDYDDDV